MSPRTHPNDEPARGDVAAIDYSKAREPGVVAHAEGFVINGSLGGGERTMRYSDRESCHADLEPCRVRIRGGEVYISHPVFMAGQWMRLVREES